MAKTQEVLKDGSLQLTDSKTGSKITLKNQLTEFLKKKKKSVK